MIAYDLAQGTEVTLGIFTVSGQEVETLVSGYQPAGRYRVTWEAGALASGVYLCRLEAAGFRQTQQMVLLR